MTYNQLTVFICYIRTKTISNGLSIFTTISDTAILILADIKHSLCVVYISTKVKEFSGFNSEEYGTDTGINMLYVSAWDGQYIPYN